MVYFFITPAIYEPERNLIEMSGIAQLKFCCILSMNSKGSTSVDWVLRSLMIVLYSMGKIGSEIHPKQVVIGYVVIVPAVAF
jgi:hypothetical protein